jgi:hypothetical protein
MFSARATGLEPVTSGVTGRAKRFWLSGDRRDSRREQGVSRLVFWDCRAPAGTCGDLVRDQHSMRRCPSCNQREVCGTLRVSSPNRAVTSCERDARPGWRHTRRMNDSDDVRVCPLCGQQVEPPLVDPTLLIEDAAIPESLHRYGFLVNEDCLLRATVPGMRKQVTVRIAAARASDPRLHVTFANTGPGGALVSAVPLPRR